MANEINIQATLTLQRYSPTLQGMGSLNITQTGTKCVSNVVNVTTGANTNIQIEGSTSISYLFVKNLDTTAWTESTNYVSIGSDSSGLGATPKTHVIARLRAGEFCMVPVQPAAVLYARATGIATDICYVAAQQ